MECAGKDGVLSVNGVRECEKKEGMASTGWMLFVGCRGVLAAGSRPFVGLSSFVLHACTEVLMLEMGARHDQKGHGAGVTT